MKITFVGTGYVGLVSGVMMSHLGHEVICLDVDKNKIDLLKNKKLPIFEHGLQEYLDKYSDTNRLKFVDCYDEKISDSECVFITVGTPPKKDGEADLSGIFSSIKQLCQYTNQDCYFIIKSTVPPGTCESIQKFIYDQGYKNEIISNPEFLREGSAVEDFIKPDRIIVGKQSQKAIEVMRNIYKPLLEQGIKIVETDLSTAELIKYTSNSFLATKIAFINEISDLCEAVGADIVKLTQGVGLDGRIGNKFFNPGPGFGGSCFPKDILALQKLAKKADSDFLVLDAVIKSNTHRPQIMLKKILDALGGSVNDKNIGILGLTYKAKTDDIRSSPAVAIIELLKAQRANIVAYDPEGMLKAKQYFKDLVCAKSALEAIANADAMVILTEWPEFTLLDFNKVKELMNTPIIIDLRNILEPDKMSKIGFKYYSLGRKNVC